MNSSLLAAETPCGDLLRFAVLLIFVCLSNSRSPGPLAFFDDSMGNTTISYCSTGAHLVAALASPHVSTADILEDLTLLEDDWRAYKSPLMLRRNFTVQGRLGLPAVAIDLNFLSGKVRLGNGIKLTFDNLVILNFRTGAPSQALGFDLLAPTNGDDAGELRLQSNALVFRTCFPLPVTRSAIQGLPPRPASVPGNQTYVLPDTQSPNCIQNSNTATFLDRCYAYRGRYTDMAWLGTDLSPVTNRPEPNGYLVHLVDTLTLCMHIMTLECIQSLGPLGCNLYTLHGLPPLMLPREAGRSEPQGVMPTASAPSAGTDGGTRWIVLGSVLGGVVLLASLTMAGILLMRRHRGGIRDPCSGQHLQKPRALVEEAQLVLNCKQGSGKQATNASDTDLNSTNKRQEGFGCASTTPDGTSGLRGLENGLQERACLGPVNPQDGTARLVMGPVVITPATPHRADLRLDVRMSSRGKGVNPAPSGRNGVLTCLPEGGKAEVAGVLNPWSANSSSAVVDRGSSGCSGGRIAAAGACMGAADPATARLHSSAAAPSDDVVSVVTLLPTVLGKGAFGRVYEGVYQGTRVAVKVVGDPAFGIAVGIAEPQAQRQQLRMEQGQQPAEHPYGHQQAQNMQSSAWGCPEDKRLDCPELLVRSATRQHHDDRLLGQFTQEVEVLGRCQHPNVVRLLAACLTPPRLCLVMELMETSLERLIFGGAGGTGGSRLLPLSKVVHIAFQVCQGLAYLHPTIVHRDLKPANVLINGADSEHPVAKIADFGLSRLRMATMPTVTPEAGTPAFQAPECFDLQNSNVTHHADMYSLGVLIWVMLTGQVPWKHLSVVAIACKIVALGERLPLHHLSNRRCPADLSRLIWQCWERDPRRRPAAEEAAKVLLHIQNRLTVKFGSTSVAKAGSSPAHKHPRSPQQQTMQPAYDELLAVKGTVQAAAGTQGTPHNFTDGCSWGEAAVPPDLSVVGAVRTSEMRNTYQELQPTTQVPDDTTLSARALESMLEGVELEI